MPRYLPSYALDVSQMTSIAQNEAPATGALFVERFNNISTQIARALAAHLDIDSGPGWHDDMEFFATLRSNTTPQSLAVAFCLEDMIDIAIETMMPNTDKFVQSYRLALSALANFIAQLLHIRVQTTSFDTTTPYISNAIFGPIEPHQPIPDTLRYLYPNETAWQTPITDLTSDCGIQITAKANRLENISYYDDTPLWPAIAAKLNAPAS